MYKVFIYNKPLFFIDNQDNSTTFQQSSIYPCENERDKQAILELHAKSPADKPLYVKHDSIEELWDLFFGDFVKMEAAGGVVENSDNEVLFIFRNGVWDLPKGKIEDGEAIDVAAIREVEEECGISDPVIEQQLITTYHTYAIQGKGYIKPTYWYWMKYEGNQELIPQLEEGITEVKWVPKSEFDNYLKDTYGSIVDVVRKYENVN